jgi:DNA invertase Pin-like site-specific DNA recombinase
MRGAIYTRVSTTDQNAEMQVRELDEYAARQGWDVFATPGRYERGQVEPARTGSAHGGCSDEEV